MYRIMARQHNVNVTDRSASLSLRIMAVIALGGVACSSLLLLGSTSSALRLLHPYYGASELLAVLQTASLTTLGGFTLLTVILLRATRYPDNVRAAWLAVLFCALIAIGMEIWVVRQVYAVALARPSVDVVIRASPRDDDVFRLLEGAPFHVRMSRSGETTTLTLIPEIRSTAVNQTVASLASAGFEVIRVEGAPK